MKDMISIIIPVYNRQTYIRECIQSIQAQSDPNYEIILIDDGSTDQTLEICKNLAQNEPRIKLLTAEHSGVSAARNKGIDMAQGEYVFFLDSDDVIHPLLLEALVEGLKNSDAAIAGTQTFNITERNWNQVNDLISKDPGPGETTYQNHQDTLHAALLGSSPLGAIGGVMMRRDLIDQTRFRTDLYIGEDFYFIYENLIKGAASVFLKQKWYYCRIHANNSSWDFGYSGFMNRLYRRELVWKSEEAFGRTQYANRQKRSVYEAFMDLLPKNPLYSTDSKQMRKTMKDYRKILLPALNFPRKVCYCLCVYLPFTCPLVFGLKKVLNKHKPK